MNLHGIPLFLRAESWHGDDISLVIERTIVTVVRKGVTQMEKGKQGLGGKQVPFYSSISKGKDRQSFVFRRRVGVYKESQYLYLPRMQ